MTRTAFGRIGGQAARALALAAIGASAGLALGLLTPTHVRIAGTDAAIRIEIGQRFDEMAFTGLLEGRRPASRTLLGEPVGVSVQLALDTSTFINTDGSFDARVLPAYIQTYSNPKQLGSDVERAIVLHLLRWAVGGAVVGLLIVPLRRGYLLWRHRQDLRAPRGAEMRETAIAYRAPERRLARRAALVIALVALIGALPGSQRRSTSPAPIVPTPLLDGTPLAGAEVGGPLLPVFNAAQAYIRRYFADTDAYYSQVRADLLDRLDAEPLTLPSGPDVVHVGFVTDRHCNTGMDRVIVALLERLDVHVLVSAGDDAFSGTFAFESACTDGLGSTSHRAGITDVFVGGNHDSPMTLEGEAKQGIRVLDGEPVTTEGLTFVGLPDPRTSRYGEGLQPADPSLRQRLLTDQGERVGELACASDHPVIVVLHDMYAGRTALEHGCGKAVLALDGHQHLQRGPLPLGLPDGSTGYLFVGASAGGAPSDETIETSFASALTVGPLRHDATVNIVSIDRTSGRLIGVTECRVSPDKSIAFDQQVVPS